MKKSLLSFCFRKLMALVLIFVSPTMLANGHSYTIKKNQTLSEILYEKKLFPIYGSSGSLKQTLALNPDLRETMGDFIRPNQSIVLPYDMTARSLAKVDERAVSVEEDYEHPEQASGPAIIASDYSEEELPENLGTNKHLTDSFMAFSDFELSLGGSYSVIYGRDPTDQTTADLLSEFSPEIAMLWHQRWSHNWQTQLHASITGIDYYSEASGRTLDTNENIKTRFGFGFGRSLGGTSVLLLDLSYEAASFYRALSSNSFLIDQVNLPVISLGFESLLVQRNKLSLSGLVRGAYWSSADTDNYDIDEGYSLSAGLRFEQKIKEDSLYCHIETMERRQDSSILDLVERKSSFLCGWIWKGLGLED